MRLKSIEPTKDHNRNLGTPLSEFVKGADENNLAEFPLALLTDTAPEGVKTLEFQDTVKDWKTGLEVTRRVCITGSDKYGLPTAKDDQVLAALLQLTGIANNFTNPEVPFTKHQVIELLHWDDSGWAYDRVEESLHRWKDVSVHYWNAWRDHEKGTWTDTEAVGIIDYFKISDGRRTQRKDLRDERSRFVWNRELFKSFQAGYMKPLDFGFYRSLKRPAAQRAYRFLDKRFHHKPEWEFDLHTFACEKLGFSRNYDTGQLKARLHPAMTELEKAGYIRPVSYKKVKPKTWSVLVAKPAQQIKDNETPGIEAPSSLAEKLTARGVLGSTAETLALEFSKERIEEKLLYVDWLAKRKDRRVPANVAGFLVAAIRNNYPLPKDYQKELQRQTRAATVPKPNRCPPNRKQVAAETPAERPNLSVIFSTLTVEEQVALEENALAAARPLERESYERQKRVGGELFEALRLELLQRYLRNVKQVAA